MAQASVSRQSIQEAIAALEAQQTDSATDADLASAIAVALDALRAALVLDGVLKAREAAVLVADLSGFTAIAERMDSEDLREALNAMWAVLDGVVAAWGGRIEQHAGDSLVALFGWPHPRPQDAWRAVHAALAMQTELALFNERVDQEAGEDSHESWLEQWPGPLMRIGVHVGPVVAADVESAGRASAAGESLRLAHDLEDAAPPGAVLVSSEVQHRIQGAFRLEKPRRRRPGLPSYVVGTPKPQEPEWRPGSLAGEVPRFVGRSEALDELENAFQRAADTSSMEVACVIGETGLGKSRLLHEFLPRLQILAPNVTVHSTRIHAWQATRAYALLRDLLRRYLSIYPAHSPQMVQFTLERSHLLDGLAADAETDREALLRLLLPDSGPPPALSEATSLARALMVRAAGDGALIIVADDLHLADAYSLALLDNLLGSPPPVPVLVVGLAQPSLLRRPEAHTISWLGELSDPFLPATRIHLPPLSAVESRLFAADLLREASPLPQRFVDLIVADANGNPWAIEENVKQMIDLEIAVPGTRWQFDMARAESMPLPRTLPDLVKARLVQLPTIDGSVIGAGAAIGTMFWDTAVASLLAPELEPDDVFAALDRLHSAGWVSRDPQCSVADAQAYYFAHALVREVAVEMLEPTVEGEFARRCAGWRRSIASTTGSAHWLPVVLSRETGDGTRESVALTSIGQAQ